MQDSLTAIIVTYNSSKHIKQCLDGLKCKNAILIDNNSKDNTLEIAQNYPCKIIKNSANLGYAKAANIGIKHAKTKYVLLINPDIYFKKDAIKKMLDFMSNHKDCEIQGPKLLKLDKKLVYSCKKFPTIKAILGRRLNIFKKDVEDYLMKDYDHKTARRVDWVSGGCMMFKNNLSLDERYFLYFEDVDFCRNKKVYYNPYAVAYHEVRRESKSNLFLLLIHISSMIKYFLKWR